MKKILVIVDMQNDNITGPLANDDAKAIVDKIVDYASRFDGNIIATRDTHDEDYLQSEEGLAFPVPHCICRTEGWRLVPEMEDLLWKCHGSTINKYSHGSCGLGSLIARKLFDEVKICGVFTDTNVISNAILIRSYAPGAKVTVLTDLCAGTTREDGDTAVQAMEACHISCRRSYENG